jgi:hypothetical protein
MLATLNEWFYMKEGRSSFLPRIPEDARLVFCHQETIHGDIIRSIEKRFATQKPIKMLIWGDWGVGKTHLTYHIRWWLEENQINYPAYPILIEIGDITKKSRFDEIVRPFLDRLGIDFLIKLVHDYRGLQPNVALSLRDKGVASHIAEAFNKMLLSSPGQAPVELVSQTFEYLKGRKIPGQASVGLSPVEQSQDFVDILTSIGEMYRAVHNGKRILFIADEAAKLDAVDADEATKNHWLTANKLIFDDRNQSFGFIYTVSGKTVNTLPQAIYEDQIQNRIGHNVFGLMTLATADVETYLKDLLNEFIDWEKVDAAVAQGEIPSAEYSRDTYPFSPKAKEQFIDYFNRAQEDSKPRDISERLDDLAFLALKKNQRYISSEMLNAEGM